MRLDGPLTTCLLIQPGSLYKGWVLPVLAYLTGRLNIWATRCSLIKNLTEETP
jgi:hypothetical protein